MKRGRPLPPVALALAVGLIGVVLLIAFGLQRGGVGTAHILAGLVVAVVGSVLTMMKGRR